MHTAWATRAACHQKGHQHMQHVAWPLHSCPFSAHVLKVACPEGACTQCAACMLRVVVQGPKNSAQLSPAQPSQHGSKGKKACRNDTHTPHLRPLSHPERLFEHLASNRACGQAVHLATHQLHKVVKQEQGRGRGGGGVWGGLGTRACIVGGSCRGTGDELGEEGGGGVEVWG